MNPPFEDGEFDHAYAIEATCHAPDRTECFKQVYRMLKPGGTFAVYVSLFLLLVPCLASVSPDIIRVSYLLVCSLYYITSGTSGCTLTSLTRTTPSTCA